MKHILLSHKKKFWSVWFHSEFIIGLLKMRHQIYSNSMNRIGDYRKLCGSDVLLSMAS